MVLHKRSVGLNCAVKICWRIRRRWRRRYEEADHERGRLVHPFIFRELAALEFLDDSGDAHETVGRVAAARLSACHRNIDMELKTFCEERLRAGGGAGMSLSKLVEVGNFLQYL